MRLFWLFYFGLLLACQHPSPSQKNTFIPVVGSKLDSLDGVYVYYNGKVSNVVERNLAPDGYNLGLKYQCVEFVKRYYYLHYHHKMPNAYGHAKDFFDPRVKDGKQNTLRNLMQCTNPSVFKPQKGDLLVMKGHGGNPYGHVAIVAKVDAHYIEMIQQNPGPFAPSRVRLPITKTNGHYHIEHGLLMGWLRKTN